MAERWDTIKLKFKRTIYALNLLEKRYQVDTLKWKGSIYHMNSAQHIVEKHCEKLPFWARHAMVLAHIAARRTDDPKLGVGSVIVESETGKYISIGWNGYPKKAQHLDYPQAGADDSVEDEELKYDYILHSGIDKYNNLNRDFIILF